MMAEFLSGFWGWTSNGEAVTDLVKLLALIYVIYLLRRPGMLSPRGEAGMRAWADTVNREVALMKKDATEAARAAKGAAVEVQNLRGRVGELDVRIHEAYGRMDALEQVARHRCFECPAREPE